MTQKDSYSEIQKKILDKVYNPQDPQEDDDERMDMLMEEITTILIAQFIEQREKENKEPKMAHYTEMQSELIKRLQTTLNNLCTSGLIRFARGLNDTFFEFSPSK